MSTTTTSSTCTNASTGWSLIDNRYQMKRKIGAGSFGQIYFAVDTITGAEVAVKRESRDSRHLQLALEHEVYRALAGVQGIPRAYYYGQHADHNVLVMDLMGESLEQLFNRCGRRFTLKTVLLLADQLLARVENLHHKHYLHRDLKPDNFLIGRTGDHRSRVYAIDFGLAKRYRSPANTRAHIPYRTDKCMIGTARYASINSHL
ncbi:unnamed protein product, partial [Medioppia subpectinata]